MIQYKRVLVPTDFSERAKLALDYAAELPFAEDAELIILHAVEPTIYPTHHVIARTDALSIESQVRKACQEHLDEACATITGVRARGELVEGYAAQEIVAAAEQEDVDLIVIATHGRSGLTHFLLGSTAEKVLRKAPCPVLSVRQGLD